MIHRSCARPPSRRNPDGRCGVPAARMPAVALAIVAVAVGACGGPPGDATDARAAVDTLLHACSEGDSVAALESLTEPARLAFARGGGTAESCSEALGLDLAPLSPEEAALAFEEARVLALEASGGIATATIEVAGRRRELEAERVGGRWRIANPDVPTG
jgi:hypothetical protein